MIYLLPNTEAGLVLANSLRDGNIGRAKGALLVREDCDGAINHLLEKIIIADKFEPGMKADCVSWKPESIVILIGEASMFLDGFEVVCPGFIEKFGPINVIEE